MLRMILLGLTFLIAILIVVFGFLAFIGLLNFVFYIVLSTAIGLILTFLAGHFIFLYVTKVK